VRCKKKLGKLAERKKLHGSVDKKPAQPFPLVSPERNHADKGKTLQNNGKGGEGEGKLEHPLPMNCEGAVV